MDAARRLVAAAGRNGEALPVVVAHGDAKALQQLQGDVDVGLGDQLAHHLDHHVLLYGHQRQCHQQRGQELAGDIAAHADRRLQLQRRQAGAVVDAQRRIAVVAQVVDLAAELAQRIDQVANRALVHARHARELVFAAQQRQRRAQRAHGRAGVAQEQSGGRRGAAAAQAGDARLCAIFLDAAAQLAQRVQHHAGVVGGQQVVHRGRALRSGRPAAARGWRCSWSRAAARCPGLTGARGDQERRGQIEKRRC